MNMLPVLLGCLALSGCGLAETAAVTGATGTSAVQEAASAKQTEDRVKQQLEATQQQDTQRRADAEREATQQ
jgi:hypothetical protein